MNPNDRRQFPDPGEFGQFASGKPTSSRESPEKIGPLTAMNETQMGKFKKSKTSRQLFHSQKHSLTELAISKDLSNIFPYSFPIIYDINLHEGSVIYSFEHLEPLVGPRGKISHFLVDPVALESMFNCFCFAAQSLFALDSLHTYMKIVHSDISPSNVMYSESSQTWKLIDFDQSLPLSESLSRSRIAGTKGFISPESKASGIFTEKSDVFSLGKVFDETINTIFLNQIHMIESGDADAETISWIREIEPIAMKFTNLISSMIQSDPSARPTALSALRSIYTLFDTHFNILADQQIFRFISSRLNIAILEEEQAQEAELEQISEKEVANPSPLLKRPRIVEEKEPSADITPQ